MGGGHKPPQTSQGPSVGAPGSVLCPWILWLERPTLTGEEDALSPLQAGTQGLTPGC